MNKQLVSTDGLVRRRWLFVVVALGVTLALVVAVVWHIDEAPERGLAGQAVVTASSTARGTSVRDAVASGNANLPGAGWQSDGETVGAWIQLVWGQPYVVRQVVLVRNLIAEPGVTDGYLGFGDGSSLQVRLSTTSRITVVPVSPRSVSMLRFTASAVSAGAASVSLAEVIVTTEPSDEDVVIGDAPDGDAARTAVTARSAGSEGVPGAEDGWTASNPLGAWVQLGWSRPRELTTVEVVGGGSAASVGGATIEFSDGTQLPLGAVLADPTRPTIVSFMPRLTTSVRLTIGRVNGAGSVTLGAVRAYERGATPARSQSVVSAAAASPDDVTCEAPVIPASGLVVRCPVNGSVVDGTVDFEVSAAAGFTSIIATVWPGDPAVPVGAQLLATPDSSGSALIKVDVSGVPPGPFVVEFLARGQDRADSAVFFQLYRRVNGPAVDLPSSAPAVGRTLAYAEEFDRPVSLSRTGAGADYAGGKPTDDGAGDFGEAPFASLQTVQVVDDRYLRIDVEPGPLGTAHYGGLLASARPGGSGFSAQYGYFEARMYVPAAPGTWPAFWMLPSDNLVTRQSVSAEIDAVELYGHDPEGACHSTHQYKDGKDGGVAQCGQRFATPREALAWHTYGVSITPTQNIFYIDGKVVATAPQVEGGGAPMFFLVNLALGGGWPVQLQGVQDRASMYVDYVRVYV